MGISTRSYARPYMGGSGLPSGIKLLLIVNFAVYLLQTFGLDNFLVGYFALRPASLFSMFAVWQLVTYMFLHAGIWHILFNMLALWMFGREIEDTWGQRKFLEFYFFCGIAAAVCVVLLSYLMPGGHPGSYTLGASGAIYGILLASAVLWPDRVIYFNFLFPIKMKYLVMIYGAIAFIGTYQGGGDVSNVGHLGGLLFGWIYMKMPSKRRVASRVASPTATLRQRYKAWKLERNKRRFQVYLKKHGSDRGDWTN